MAGISLLFDAEGAPLELHARVGEGGEATVRHVAGRDGVLAKVYKEADDLDEHARKVVALVAMASPGLEKVAAWPRQLVVDGSGQAVGFLMEHLKGWTPLFTVYQTRSRLRQMPQGDWGFLVRVGRNLATAVAAVHKSGLVIGDLNESNVLVSGQAMVKLIDVDSFQVEVDGRVMGCPVGKAEYLAPELQGRDLELMHRNQWHDLFALAVLLFQTLMLGRHPHAGRPCGAIEPTLEESVANHWYAHTVERDVPLRPPPGVTTNWLPPLVRSLFERAFGSDPAARPTAKVWSEALKELEQELATCSPGHVYWSGLAACPWCRLEKRSRTRVFGVPVDGKSVALSSADEALAELQEAVDRSKNLPARVPHAIPLEALAGKVKPAETYEMSIEQRNNLSREQLLYGAQVAGSTGLFLLASMKFNLNVALAPLFFMPAYMHFRFGRRAKRIRTVRKERDELAGQLEDLRAKWNKGDLSANLVARRNALNGAVKDAEAVDSKRQEIRERYLTRTYWNEVNRFLSKYSVLVADVRELSVRRLNALYEQGLRTAADIVPSKMEGIPDLDKAAREELLDWRKRMSQQFWRSSSFPLPPEVEALADKEFATWARETASRITENERAIQVLTREVDDLRQKLAPQIMDAYQRARIVERDYLSTQSAILVDRISFTRAKK